MRIYVNGVQQGGSAGIPGTPAEVLLDLANAGKGVGLASGTGEGAAITYGTMLASGIGQIAALNGDFPTNNGAGGSVLASLNGAAVRGIIGAASDVAPYYASDGVASPGSESASVSGTGTASTVTLTASSSARNFGSAGQTAAGWYVDLPAGTLVVDVEVQITAASGLATGGYRYLGIALSNQTNVSTTLCGVSMADSGNAYSGSLLGGANAGNGPLSYSPTLTAADRWVRARIELDAGAMLRFATGSGTAGARPGTWSLPYSAIPLPASGSTGTVVDSNSARLWLYLQGFGSGGATSVTAKITVQAMT